MELLKQILENPLYLVLFGSGGIVIAIISLISLKSKKEEKISINIDVNSDKKRNDNLNGNETKCEGCNLRSESNPIIDKSEENNYIDFASDENKSDLEPEFVIDKPEKYDHLDSALDENESNLEPEFDPTMYKSEDYEIFDFNTEEYYVAFLKTVEEKKKAGDEFEYK